MKTIRNMFDLSGVKEGPRFPVDSIVEKVCTYSNGEPSVTRMTEGCSVGDRKKAVASAMR